MARLTQLFITLCAIVIAACLAVALYAAAEVPIAVAGLMAAGFLAIAMLIRGVRADRVAARRLAEELDEDRSTVDALIQRVERFDIRMRAFESAPAKGGDDILAVEIETLSTLV